MLDIERLQCPSCGATLCIDGPDTLSCAYCCSRFRLRPGASGHPWVVRDEVKEDASSLARRATLARLQDDMIRLQTLREKMVAAQQRQAAELQANDIGCLVLCGFGCAIPTGLIGLGAMLFSAALVSPGNLSLALVGTLFAISGIGVAAWMVGERKEEWKEAHRRVGEADKQHRADLAALEARIAQVRGEVAAVKAEMDRATGGM